MRIEINLRDTHPNGKRIGGRRVNLESCRVFREAGDGLRLDNLAQSACAWFHAAALCFIKDDPTNPNEKGTLCTDKRMEQYTKE